LACRFVIEKIWLLFAAKANATQAIPSRHHPSAFLPAYGQKACILFNKLDMTKIPDYHPKSTKKSVEYVYNGLFKLFKFKERCDQLDSCLGKPGAKVGSF